MAKKVQFQFGNETYEIFTNGKEYGAAKTLYLSYNRKGGSHASKGAYSVRDEQFTQHGGGIELQILKAGAAALGIIE